MSVSSLTKSLRVFGAAAALVLAGCATPDKPVRATLYDFGPGVLAARPTGSATRPSIMLAEVEPSASFENTGVMYRLGYADPHQLRPYSLARWSAPPAALVRQRLREQLGRDRLVLDLEEAAALARAGGVRPRILRIELEEFSHYFQSPAESVGLLRLRATLMENTPGGERLIGQRLISAQHPAPTPDAPGGVRALAGATEAAAQEIAQWLEQAR
jgi:cholesterol transport system auxiliary component